MKAAFQGSYADLKFIKSRSVAAITVEIPIEQAGAFVASFGAPTPGSECPVAIARLDLANAVSEPPAPVNDAPKERRRFNELPLPQQAAMRCNEPSFWRFLNERFSNGKRVFGSEVAASIVRNLCDVKSRSEITPGEIGNRWLFVEGAYQVWLLETSHV